MQVGKLNAMSHQVMFHGSVNDYKLLQRWKCVKVPEVFLVLCRTAGQLHISCMPAALSILSLI